MWSKLFGCSVKQTARFVNRANSPLLRRALTRVQSTGTNQASWNIGGILGAGALGLTCCYLTSKAFAQSKDNVGCVHITCVICVGASWVEDNEREIHLQGRYTAVPQQGASVAFIIFFHYRIFSGSGNRELAKSICSYLGVNLQDAVVDRFNDGEIEIRLNRNVRGKKIFIVQSTCPPVLLFLLAHF